MAIDPVTRSLKMKRCVAVGDLFVTSDAMAKGLAPLAECGYELEVTEFSVGDFDSLQEVNLEIEQHSPSVIELPSALTEKMLAADVIVVHFCPVSAELIKKHSHLECIGTCRTGMSNIDSAAAQTDGIPVVNCQGRLANAVADFTVGMMICEARNIARGHAGLKAGQWIRRYRNLGNIPDLPNRVVGLVGLGAIGKATAKRLAAFDMKILAHDPFVPEEVARQYDVELVSLETLMRQSDFVSIHVDLRESTKNIINADLIKLMKPTAYFINTARAGVVDEAALIEALQNNRIAGAALDTFTEEPPKLTSPLVQLENVTLTPHMAGGSDDAFRNSPKLLCELLKKTLNK